MKKGFLAEVKRLDASSFERYEPTEEIVEFEACELQPDYLENLIEIRKTLAGRLALDLDDEKKNRYWDSHLWELYYDLYGDEDWQDSPSVECSLSICLMELEKENVLSFEADEIFNKLKVSDEEYLEKREQVQIEYRKRIITECYSRGKFRTANWRLKVRHL